MNTDALKQAIAESGNIVFFGGAGTSTESGIPDFRSAQGLFREDGRSLIRPEEILEGSFFRKHPDQFYRFYRDKLLHPQAQPNTAHRILAELEQAGKLTAVITQNIDGLHQLAGSRNVLELHGSVHRNYCMRCRMFHSLDFILSSPSEVPYCKSCEGLVKPDVVLYSENLDEELLRRATEAIKQADILIVAGTSLSVYPAAGLVDYYTGNRLVLINKSATPYDHHADYVFPDSVGKVLQELVP